MYGESLLELRWALAAVVHFFFPILSIYAQEKEASGGSALKRWLHLISLQESS